MKNGYIFIMIFIYFRTELSPACSNFIKKYFKFSWEGTIKVMEKLAVLNCDLVITVIKTLSACVLELEAKRGVGVDKRLRYVLVRPLVMQSMIP